MHGSTCGRARTPWHSPATRPASVPAFWMRVVSLARSDQVWHLPAAWPAHLSARVLDASGQLGQVLRGQLQRRLHLQEKGTGPMLWVRGVSHCHCHHTTAAVAVAPAGEGSKALASHPGHWSWVRGVGHCRCHHTTPRPNLYPSAHEPEVAAAQQAVGRGCLRGLQHGTCTQAPAALPPAWEGRTPGTAGGRW